MFRTYLFPLLCLFFFSQLINSQTIAIDGYFEDWNDVTTTIIDDGNSSQGVDLKEIQITNDQNYLYIKIKAEGLFDLTDNGDIYQDILVYIDTDDNGNTGYGIEQNFGAEIGIAFADLDVYDYSNSFSTLSLYDIGLRCAPTVTSDEFEIAIERDAVLDGINPLFNSSTIKIIVANTNNNDVIPNDNTYISYTFDEDNNIIFDSTTLIKEASNAIRFLSYNTLQSGLLDNERIPYFEKIVTVINPDIIGFVESYNTSAAQAKILLDEWLPLGTTDGWYTTKDEDLIVASRWEIIDQWYGITRQFPVLIDLPESYGTDILFTNSHLSCCANDDGRQEQVDEYAAFILDVKNGDYNIDPDTPFVYAGDLNLVGASSQLETLLTGQIVNSNIYGFGAPLDWDGTSLTSDDSLHTTMAMNYTWRASYGYPPGKLDFIIYSDSVLEKEKSFVLETETTSTEILNQNGLSALDTYFASDHLPVVADFSIKQEALNTTDNETLTFSVYPNPSSDIINISLTQLDNYTFKIFDVLGNTIFTENKNTNSFTVNLDNFASGLYHLTINDSKGNLKSTKIIKE